MEYLETFDGAGNGWLGWGNRQGDQVASGVAAPVLENGCAVSRGPWWVDANHAPPGGGYLHIHYCLHTTVHKNTPIYDRISGGNTFIKGGYPLDFRDAEFTVRIKGDIDQKGANLVFLAQADVGKVRSNHVLTAQPIEITPDFTEQTLVLEPDPAQWTALGSRHDRTDLYGEAPIEDMLANLNVDFILVHFPLNVKPTPGVELEDDPHILYADRDYPVDRSLLPTGEICLDEVRIKFKSSA